MEWGSLAGWMGRNPWTGGASRYLKTAKKAKSTWVGVLAEFLRIFSLPNEQLFAKFFSTFAENFLSQPGLAPACLTQAAGWGKKVGGGGGGYGSWEKGIFDPWGGSGFGVVL